jgi:uncharacterized protein
MQYDPEVHSLKCPKCDGGMESHVFDDVTIDRCTHCEGIWFDKGEEHALKDKGIAKAVDIGDPAVGRQWDFHEEDVDCPRCGKRMQKGSDPEQPHIWYEFCEDHGLFMDAGEFKDYNKKNWVDWFRFLNKGSR